MQLSIDGKTLGDPPEAVKTFEDLLGHVSQLAEGRLVVGIRLDGQPLADQQIDAIRPTLLSKLGALELETESPFVLAATALAQAADMLEQCRGHHGAIAELIAAGKPAKAMERLTECFSVWNAVEQSVRQTSRAVGIDLDTAQIGQTSPAHLIAALATHLQDIQECLQNRDFVGIADLVGHDMTAISDGWQGLLIGFQERLLARA